LINDSWNPEGRSREGETREGESQSVLLLQATRVCPLVHPEKNMEYFWTCPSERRETGAFVPGFCPHWIEIAPVVFTLNL
jgi:hypothetical protein